MLNTEVILGFTFIEYDEWITKIRTCRHDLTADKLKLEIDKLAHDSGLNHRYLLQTCYESAARGDAMPWEEDT